MAVTAYTKYNGGSAAIASLTDNSGGTASNTIADISATYVEAEVANAVKSLSTKLNLLIAANRAAGIIQT